MADITLDAIALPADLHWVDEYTWTPIGQSAEYLDGGTLYVTEATRLAGRPITLANQDAWVTRATIELVRAKLIADQTMTLTLADGRTFDVRWRHNETPLESSPVRPLAPQVATDNYRLTLRLMEAPTP